MWYYLAFFIVAIISVLVVMNSLVIDDVDGRLKLLGAKMITFIALLVVAIGSLLMFLYELKQQLYDA